MFRTNRILVAIDFSEGSEKALALAHRLSENSLGTLHLVHVKVLFGDDDDADVGESPELLQGSMETLYRRVCEQYGLRADRAVEFTALRDVAPAAALLRYAADKHCELIVTGTHGRRGFRRMILGSVAEELVRLAPCPVLTVSEKLAEVGTLKSILVPIDFSLYSKAAVSVARELASAYGASLHLLHVVEEAMHPAFYNAGVFSVYDMDPEIEKKALNELQRLNEGAAGPEVPVEYALRHGNAAREIVDHGAVCQSDLIVMSTHGLTGIRHVLIGSVAERVVRTAPCPVLIMKEQRSVLAGETSSPTHVESP